MEERNQTGPTGGRDADSGRGRGLRFGLATHFQAFPQQQEQQQLRLSAALLLKVPARVVAIF